MDNRWFPYIYSGVSCTGRLHGSTSLPSLATTTQSATSARKWSRWGQAGWTQDWSFTQKPTKGALLVFSTIQRGCTQKSGRIDQEVRDRPIERWIRGVPPTTANCLPEVPPGIRIREAKPGGNHQHLRKNELFFIRYSTCHLDNHYHQVFHWIWNWRWSHMFALYCWGMAS